MRAQKAEPGEGAAGVMGEGSAPRSGAEIVGEGGQWGIYAEMKQSGTQGRGGRGLTLQALVLELGIPAQSMESPSKSL